MPSYPASLNQGPPTSILDIPSTGDIRAALQAAITDDTDGLIRLPSGTYTVTTTVPAPSLTVAGDRRAVGAGNGRTVVYVGPETPANAFKGFDVAATKRLTLEGLTLRGPTDPGTLLTGDVLTGTDTVAVNHQGGAGGAVSLRDVVMDGWWKNNVACGDQDADTRCTIENCDLQAWGACLTGTGHPSAIRRKRIVVRNSKLRGKGASFASGLAHLVYPGPTTSLLFENVEFYDSPGDGYCVHHYSGAATVGARFDAIFRDCYVDETCTNGYYLSNVGRSLIDGGVIRATQRGVVPRGPLTALGVHFEGCQAAVRHAGSAESGTVFEFDTCTWDGCTTNIEGGFDGTIWRARGGVMNGGAIVSNDGSTALLTFTGVVLNNVTFSVAADARFAFRDCITMGTTVLPTGDNITATGGQSPRRDTLGG